VIVDVEMAAAALVAGTVVAIPTDTLYGLAADVGNPEAVETIFNLKQRPRDVQMPVLVADVPQARGLAVIPSDRVERVLSAFWPGALTVVLDRLDGTGTVGLRCPDSEVVRDLCRRVGPLACTSANLHGAPPLTTADAVIGAFGDVVPVIDGGSLAGEPSTVVDFTGPEPKLLRQGAIPFDAVQSA
jgi:L-threonylcarbamoyladenylate synthase